MSQDEDTLIGDLVAEFLDRKNSGESPNSDEFLARCPADRRAEFRAALSFVDKTGPQEAPAPLETGFDIKEELGRGAFGRVFLAVDKALGREVALKILVNAGISSGAREQFLREARVLASLRHPNIVQIHSIDEEKGRIRLSLERIEGETLDRVAQRQGPFAPEEAARIGGDLCRALSALHGKGLVHRDLKPSNVIREVGGRIVLLDFGLARSTSPDAASERDIAGTPLVMAPEQFDLDREVGPRADIYALGVLLYWMVAGKYPFAEEEFEALREKVQTGDATPLADRSPSVPASFAAIVSRAMATREEDRFASAGALEEALRGFFGGASLAKTGRLRRNVVLAGIVCVGILAALSFFWPSSHWAKSSLSMQANLYAEREGAAVSLRSGDAIFVGDGLHLALSLEQKTYVYVFDEDAAGNAFALFPLTGYELQNPLPAGRDLRLPGKKGGAEISWMIDSLGGGEERILIVASTEPDESAEALWKELPQPQEGTARGYDALSERTRGLLQRGAGATKKAEPASTARPVNAGARRISEFFPEIDEESVPDGSVRRMIRLKNEGKK